MNDVESICAVHIVGDPFPDDMEPKGETVQEVGLRVSRNMGSKLHELAKRLGVEPQKSQHGIPKGVYVGSHKDQLYDLYAIFLKLLDKIDK